MTNSASFFQNEACSTVLHGSSWAWAIFHHAWA